MPNLSLYYWFRGQSPDAWYTVEVSSDMTIGQLKNLIAQGSRILSQCDPEVLNVYKVPVDQPVVGDASLEHNLGSLYLYVGHPFAVLERALGYLHVST